MTHTPGPWLINFDPEDDERPLEIVTSDRDHRIAFLASDGKPDDARLIAAAADLLAALKFILPLAKAYTPVNQSASARRTCDEWINAAKTAIARATGQ